MTSSPRLWGVLEVLGQAERQALQAALEIEGAPLSAAELTTHILLHELLIPCHRWLLTHRSELARFEAADRQDLMALSQDWRPDQLTRAARTIGIEPGPIKGRSRHVAEQAIRSGRDLELYEIFVAQDPEIMGPAHGELIFSLALHLHRNGVLLTGPLTQFFDDATDRLRYYPDALEGGE